MMRIQNENHHHAGTSDVDTSLLVQRNTIVMNGQNSPQAQPKVFRDAIYGDISVHPLCVAIIDTKEFQRLRFIKQLGLTFFVYPGGVHSRFEHCIGVYHLSGEFARVLRKVQPELGIDDRDILCVQIAGLCHDLGHGPFSHTWERFMDKKLGSHSWSHEQSSITLFDYLIEKNGLSGEFLKYFGEDFKEYIVYVKQQIAGTNASRNLHPWIANRGSLPNKNFLYEIIANRDTGMDVDKWDYISRDILHTGFTAAFDYGRLMNFARVCETDTGKHICFRDKELVNASSLFSTRLILHRQVYRHRVVSALEIMFIEALCESDEFFKISGSEGRYTLSEAAKDPEAFCKLTDGLYEHILNSDDDGLKEARAVLMRIQRRHLYTYVGQTAVNDETIKDLKLFPEEIFSRVPPDKEVCKKLSSSDIILNVANFNYGMGNRNPIDSAYYYSKTELNYGRRLESSDHSRLQSVHFEETFLVCFCKVPEMTHLVKIALDDWCNAKGLKLLNY